jgi:hypothetical protein
VVDNDIMSRSQESVKILWTTYSKWIRSVERVTSQRLTVIESWRLIGLCVILIF